MQGRADPPESYGTVIAVILDFASPCRQPYPISLAASLSQVGSLWSGDPRLQGPVKTFPQDHIQGSDMPVRGRPCLPLCVLVKKSQVENIFRVIFMFQAFRPAPRKEEMPRGYCGCLSVIQGQQGCLLWLLLSISPSLSSSVWSPVPCSCSSLLLFSAHTCWKDTA